MQLEYEMEIYIRRSRMAEKALLNFGHGTLLPVNVALVSGSAWGGVAPSPPLSARVIQRRAVPLLWAECAAPSKLNGGMLPLLLSWTKKYFAAVNVSDIVVFQVY